MNKYLSVEKERNRVFFALFPIFFLGIWLYIARTTKINPATATVSTETGSGKALPDHRHPGIAPLRSTRGRWLFLLPVPSVAQGSECRGDQEPERRDRRYLELPTDEEPTLATVTDREKLAEQPFFQKAENGDKVLIYSNSGRAVLYRPYKEKKIIDVTTVNVTKPEPEVPVETPSVAPSPEVSEQSSVPAIIRVALYNGSIEVGVTNSIESVLRAAVPNAAVVTKETAVKNDYQKTLVIDVSGANGAAALSVASAVGGEVGGLPAGEKAPANADVIVGNDR